MEGSGFRFHFRSTGLASSCVEVAVGDTTGELRRFTQLADLVFVGKSLEPHHEGQTPIEAAVLGKALLFGARMSNFKEIALALRGCGAALPVADAKDLAGQCVALLSDPGRREAMASAAKAWHQVNQGAISRTVVAVRAELGFEVLR